MNQLYLKSLAGYLVINTTIWLLLSLVVGGHTTLGNFLGTTAIAVLIHRFFIWGRRG